MLELGDNAETLHREVGDFAARQGVDLLLACGVLAKFIAEAAQQAEGKTEASFFKTKEDVLKVLKEKVRPGDVVLVKGSRGMKMEKVLECFTI